MKICVAVLIFWSFLLGTFFQKCHGDEVQLMDAKKESAKSEVDPSMDMGDFAEPEKVVEKRATVKEHGFCAIHT